MNLQTSARVEPALAAATTAPAGATHLAVIGIVLAPATRGDVHTRRNPAHSRVLPQPRGRICTRSPIKLMEILQIRVGDRVRVRQRTWIVEEVESGNACRILTLAGAEQSGRAHLRVIHPFDDVDAAATRRNPKRSSIGRWRAACCALVASSGDATSVRTAAAARMELLPYQLEPALAFLTGRGSRVLLADEVGLGKTIQAMLAARELHVRGAAPRILILCPAGLREQWVEECAARFDLCLALIDHAGLRRASATLPAGVNPWATEPLVVASVDYVKRPEVLPAVMAANWDLVVVDEAHGACGDSDRRDAVAQLCARAAYVLLLTATPHSGDEAAFASLCRLGAHDDELVVFRRSRLEAGRDAGRRAHTLRVRLTEPERRMHAALAALTRAVRRESTTMERHAWLLLSLLHKRALSSAHALAASAERRLRLLGDDGARGPDQLLLPLDDEGGELDTADAAPMWSEPALHDVRRERRLLERLVDAAREAEGQEGKLRRLRRLLSAIDEPAIVFTEYRDTLLHVRNQVAPHASVLHGGLTREQRHAALASFATTRLLLATDAAGEGLNLQRDCRCVINLELPWNPMRLEQRIGRVDRIGQRRRVHVFHLVSSGTGELRLLDRLSARVSHADARVGAPNPLLGRPEWTEDASARVVVLRQAPQRSRATPAVATVALTRLDAEAARECSRIARLRTWAARSILTRTAHAKPPNAALVAWTRRARTRAVLQGRVLVIARSTIADSDGRAIATRLDGLLCERLQLTGIREYGSSALASIIGGPEYVGWRDASLEAHTRMTTLREERLRRIEAMLGGRHEERQPGLFDRRAEHAWDVEEQERRLVLAHVHDRLRRAEAALRMSVPQPEVVLVLVPRGRTVQP